MVAIVKKTNVMVLCNWVIFLFRFWNTQVVSIWPRTVRPVRKRFWKFQNRSWMNDFSVWNVDCFCIVISIVVPIICSCEKIFHGCSITTFCWCENPIGTNDNTTTSNTLQMDQPFIWKLIGFQMSSVFVFNSDVIIYHREVKSYIELCLFHQPKYDVAHDHWRSNHH